MMFYPSLYSLLHTHTAHTVATYIKMPYYLALHVFSTPFLPFMVFSYIDVYKQDYNSLYGKPCSPLKIEVFNFSKILKELELELLQTEGGRAQNRQDMASLSLDEGRSVGQIRTEKNRREALERRAMKEKEASAQAGGTAHSTISDSPLDGQTLSALIDTKKISEENYLQEWDLIAKVRNAGLAVIEVEKDGDCQFSVFLLILLEAGQATINDTCESIRNNVVEYIRANQVFYKDLYVDDDELPRFSNFDDFLTKMKQPHEFGNQITLHAFAHKYCLNVKCLDPFNSQDYFGGNPQANDTIFTIIYQPWALHYTYSRLAGAQEFAILGDSLSSDPILLVRPECIPPVTREGTAQERGLLNDTLSNDPNHPVSPEVSSSLTQKRSAIDVQNEANAVDIGFKKPRVEVLGSPSVPRLPDEVKEEIHGARRGRKPKSLSSGGARRKVIPPYKHKISCSCECPSHTDVKSMFVTFSKNGLLCAYHVNHFKASNLYTLNGKKYVQKNSDGSLTVLPATNFISNFHNHDEVIASLVTEGNTSTLATSYGVKSGNKCICAESEDGRGPPPGSCQEDLSRSGAGYHTVPKRDKSIFVKWVKILDPFKSMDSIEKLFSSGTTALVAREHFRATDFKEDELGRRILSREAVPTRRHVEPHIQYGAPVASPTASKKENMYLLGDMKKAILEVGGTISDEHIAALKKFLDDYEGKRSKLDDTSTELKGQPNSTSASAPTAPRPIRTILECVKKDPHYCQTNTGLPSYRALVALFNVLNATGAIERMRLTAPSRQTKPIKEVPTGKETAASNKYKHSSLPPLEQFVLVLLMGRKMRGNVDTLSTQFTTFDLAVDTCWRYHDAFTAFISWFAGLLPTPTFEQLLCVTPSQHHSINFNRGMPQKCATVVADCTGVYTEDPSRREFHIMMFDEYYKGTILKLATLIAGNGYIINHIFSLGPVDDDEVLDKNDIPEILKKILDERRRLDPNATLVLYYDKGLGNYYVLEKNGIVIVVPNKNTPGQLLFSGPSIQGGKEEATGRIIVENVNEELKVYDMFNAKKLLARLDMAEHEINTVRFLVNCKPAVNAWASVSTLSF